MTSLYHQMPSSSTTSSIAMTVLPPPPPSLPALVSSSSSPSPPSASCPSCARSNCPCGPSCECGPFCRCVSASIIESVGAVDLKSKYAKKGLGALSSQGSGSGASPPQPPTTTVVVRVMGMTCTNCSAGVERAVKNLNKPPKHRGNVAAPDPAPGAERRGATRVLSCEVSLLLATATVVISKWDAAGPALDVGSREEYLSAGDVVACIDDAGYDATLIKATDDQDDSDEGPKGWSPGGAAQSADSDPPRRTYGQVSVLSVNAGPAVTGPWQTSTWAHLLKEVRDILERGGAQPTDFNIKVEGGGGAGGEGASGKLLRRKSKSLCWPMAFGAAAASRPPKAGSLPPPFLLKFEYNHSPTLGPRAFLDAVKLVPPPAATPRRPMRPPSRRSFPTTASSRRRSHRAPAAPSPSSSERSRRHRTPSRTCSSCS